MNLKFLPIGSVCLVEGVNKKQMVIGYLKSGYDYVAVEYPKGFETDNRLSYFNHEQVKELYSLGYKNEESRIYTGTLVSSSMSLPVSDEDELEESALKVSPVIEELKFDENGVVISDGETTLEEVQPLTGNLTFDENGVVISDGETTLEEKKKTETKLEFDENGVVISDGETTLEEKKTPKTKLEFDENGVVISDGETTLEEKKVLETKLEFDENGVVISDGETTLEEKKVPETKLEFDENGVVISDGENILETKKDANEDDLVSTNENDVIVLDDAATIDVSDVVKQIEETVKEADKKKSQDSEPSKKEKRGLFHFGRK